jgi:hypothetical protein
MKNSTVRRPPPTAFAAETPSRAPCPPAASDQQPGQQHERQHDAGGESQPVGRERAGVRAVLREPEQLQGQHRKDARHQVQDQAADQRQPSAAISDIDGAAASPVRRAVMPGKSPFRP